MITILLIEILEKKNTYLQNVKLQILNLCLLLLILSYIQYLELCSLLQTLKEFSSTVQHYIITFFPPSILYIKENTNKEYQSLELLLTLRNKQTRTH